MPESVKVTESDLYSDTPETAVAAETESEADDSEDTAEGDDSEGSTALLPLNFFGRDVKPGDTCEVKVVRVHDNQVEVNYQKKSDAAETEEAEEAPATVPEAEMASMME